MCFSPGARQQMEALEPGLPPAPSPQVVEGWAIYDLLDDVTGAAFLAERCLRFFARGPAKGEKASGGIFHLEPLWSPSNWCPCLAPLVGRVRDPTKIAYGKKGTLILTPLLEGLVTHFRSSWP